MDCKSLLISKKSTTKLRERVFNNFFKLFHLILLLLVSKTLFAANLTLSVTPNKTQYDNGDRITYRIKIQNNSANDIENLKLTMPLSSKGFIDLDNQLITSPEGTAHGEYDQNADFQATKVIIPAGKYIEYEINGTIKNDFTGDDIEVELSADVDGTISILKNTITRVPYSYNLTITGSSTTYFPTAGFTYTVKVQNTGISDIKNLGLNMPTPVGFQITNITGIVKSKPGTTATGNTGTFNPKDTFNVVGASMDKNSWLEYIIQGTIAAGTTGDLDATVKSTIRGIDDENASLKTPKGEIEVTLTANAAKYKPYNTISLGYVLKNNSPLNVSGAILTIETNSFINSGNLKIGTLSSSLTGASVNLDSNKNIIVTLPKMGPNFNQTFSISGIELGNENIKDTMNIPVNLSVLGETKTGTNVLIF